MNGKKAKLLRNLAGLNKHNKSDTTYSAIKHTFKEKSVLSPDKINSDGSPVVLGTYRTVSFAMDSGVRAMYKLLKRGYKNKLKNPTNTMLAG